MDKKRILVIDDAMFIRNVLKKILINAGFEVVGEASTGIEGVEKYKELRPDLVTMDIVMPDMDGIEALKEIRSFDNHAKVVIVSSMGNNSKIIQAIENGAKNFIIKPFDENKLIEVLKSII